MSPASYRTAPPRVGVRNLTGRAALAQNQRVLPVTAWTRMSAGRGHCIRELVTPPRQATLSARDPVTVMATAIGTSLPRHLPSPEPPRPGREPLPARRRTPEGRLPAEPPRPRRTSAQPAREVPAHHAKHPAAP